ncbi:MAG: hypothetical protein OXR66_07020 [Candidatus Woesearchaeota archaeon]|nr:hypothetical protein [Candidatus Woesearchaeota archaeon]
MERAITVGGQATQTQLGHFVRNLADMVLEVHEPLVEDVRVMRDIVAGKHVTQSLPHGHLRHAFTSLYRTTAYVMRATAGLLTLQHVQYALERTKKEPYSSNSSPGASGLR